jgi:hypothetical protein
MGFASFGSADRLIEAVCSWTALRIVLHRPSLGPNDTIRVGVGARGGRPPAGRDVVIDCSDVCDALSPLSSLLDPWPSRVVLVMRIDGVAGLLSRLSGLGKSTKSRKEPWEDCGWQCRNGVMVVSARRVDAYVWEP